MHPGSTRLRVILALLGVIVVTTAGVAARRVARVRSAAEAMPVYPGAREGARHVRYFPRLLSWDDRSSARVRRIFSLPDSGLLGTVARAAHDSLVASGWYLVDRNDLARAEPQVVVWQRDPDERLDLVRLWPVPNMTREQRLYGGAFPPALLDMPMVYEWTWALGGPRAQRPVAHSIPLLSTPLPPSPPPTPSQ